jgi:hypothetical protein
MRVRDKAFELSTETAVGVIPLTSSLKLVDAILMFSSSRSKTAIHLGFPAAFEADVRDPLRRVAFCRLASTHGWLL